MTNQELKDRIDLLESLLDPAYRAIGSKVLAYAPWAAKLPERVNPWQEPFNLVTHLYQTRGLHLDPCERRPPV